MFISFNIETSWRSPREQRPGRYINISTANLRTPTRRLLETCRALAPDSSEAALFRSLRDWISVFRSAWCGDSRVPPRRFRI